MTFTGLPTLQLLGLGLVSFIIIFGLYRLRDRRPTTTVASLEIYRELAAQHLRRRSLRQLLSILVQLLILTLLLLALSEPERRVSTEQQRHVLVLFDSSASMQVNEGTSTRFELAQKRLLNFIESLEPNTEVLLATIDSALTPQLPWTTDRNALRAAVKELKALPLPSRDYLRQHLSAAEESADGRGDVEVRVRLLARLCVRQRQSDQRVCRQPHVKRLVQRHLPIHVDGWGDLVDGRDRRAAVERALVEFVGVPGCARILDGL